LNQSEFVDLLHKVLLEGQGAKLVADWSNPPGRSLGAERLGRKAWIKRLSAEDRAQLAAFAADAMHASLFGMLCVLDGNRAIEDGDRGHVELFHVENGTRTLLASSDMNTEVLPLHELLLPPPAS
jgi:hypothetical protein